MTRTRNWIVLTALAAMACSSSPRAPAPSRPIAYAALLGIIESGDAEARYHAVLELARYPGPGTRERLRVLTTSNEILTQNAAARVLVEHGVREAVPLLIENLDRDNRTWAVSDAIHHLHELFGTTWGYDPDRGYRAQMQAQSAWWGWWNEGDLLGWSHPEDVERREARRDHAALADTLAAKVDAYLETEPDDRDASWQETVALWQALAELQPSREPAHVALVCRAFGEMTRRWPTDPALANNHALAALNNGEYEASEASYRHALDLSPDEAYFHNDYGILLEGLGRLEEAAAQYREAIRLDPSEVTWFGNLGDVLRKLGRVGAAVAAYREAEQLAPEQWYYHRLWIKRLTGPDATDASARAPSTSAARSR